MKRDRFLALLGLSVLAFLVACGASATSAPETGKVFQVTTASFTHPNLSIPVGTKVQWTNADSASHTVTSGKDGKFDGSGWNSPELAPGRVFQLTFEKTGAFTYTCTIHPTMNAVVTVIKSGTPSTEIPKGGESGGFSY